MKGDWGGGFTLKDVIDRIDEIKKSSDIADKEHSAILNEIRNHAALTNGRVTELERDVANLKMIKADNKELQKVRTYSIGNWMRDNPRTTATIGITATGGVIGFLSKNWEKLKHFLFGG